MHSACQELFEYSLRYVTRRDIEDFCLSDPGYWRYVKEWTGILLSKKVPAGYSFEFSEIIVSTSPWLEYEGEQLTRSLRFCVFVQAAAGVKHCALPDEKFSTNWLVIRLIDAAWMLDDKSLLRLLPAAFREMHKVISGDEWFEFECPFFLLGQLILACAGHGDPADVPSLAAAIMEEDEKGARIELARVKDRHLLPGCTFYTFHHDRWRHYVQLTFPENPKDENLALLREALLAPPPLPFGGK